MVHDVAELGYQARFLDADLYVFEFGIYYQLFDAIFLVRGAERVLAVYHNITPVELITDPAVRSTVERSTVQRNNLTQAGHIACVSDFNRRDLLGLGFDPSRLSVLHLPPGHSVRPGPRSPAEAPVELIFVGRIVRAKGVLDLLEACHRLDTAGAGPFRVSIVGSPAFSEASVLRCAAGLGGNAPFAIWALWTTTRSPAPWSRPTYWSCPATTRAIAYPSSRPSRRAASVIAYDAGNLPSIVDGHGHVVATGDVEALTEAMAIAISDVADARRGAPAFVTTSSGRIEERIWRARVAEHVEQHGQHAYELQLLRLLADRERAVQETGARR